MRLFHGTNDDFMAIDLDKSRIGKDFGLGYYLTPSFEIAERQAKRKIIQYGLGEVYVYDYDIVVGPIADDTVGYQIRRFEDGIITKEQFLEMIKFHTITVQYLFATEKSITKLKRL